MEEAKTILVVDDEIHIVNVVVMNLRKAGYRVLTAQDPEQAFEIARTQIPDLVITDHNMPGGSGVDFCKQLKNRSIIVLPTLPIKRWPTLMTGPPA